MRSFPPNDYNDVLNSPSIFSWASFRCLTQTSVLPYHIKLLNSRNFTSYAGEYKNEATINFHFSPHVPSMEPAQSSCLAGILMSFSFFVEKHILILLLRFSKTEKSQFNLVISETTKGQQCKPYTYSKIVQLLK